MKVSIIVPIIKITDNAFTTGDTPRFIDAYMYIGNVGCPFPETNDVMTKSSKESVIAIKNPAIIPGIIIGIITFTSVVNSLAPRSYAASTTE